jgi:hypothetical protein
MLLLELVIEKSNEKAKSLDSKHDAIAIHDVMPHVLH